MRNSGEPRCGASCVDSLHDPSLNIGEPVVAALETERELFVVETKQVHDRLLTRHGHSPNSIKVSRSANRSSLFISSSHAVVRPMAVVPVIFAPSIRKCSLHTSFLG